MAIELTTQHPNPDVDTGGIQIPYQVTTVRDRVIREAKSLPDLVAKAQKVDPGLAEQLTGKALWTSKSPPAIAVAAVLTWASTKYGFGWDEATVNMVTLLVGVVAAYGMRTITSAPITTLFSKPTVPPPTTP